MEFLQQVTEQFNNELRSNILDIIQKHNIPCDFGEHSSEFCITIFAANKDILTSPKKLSKYQLAHPNMEITYAPGYNFDFSELEKLPASQTSEKPRKLFVIWNELLKEEWTAEVIRTITSWSKSLFSKVMPLYTDKYSIKLFRLPFGVFLENPETMCISKLPEFAHLEFYSPYTANKIVDSKAFLKDQAEILGNISNSFFRG